MVRSLAVAGLGFTIVLIGVGAMLLHPVPGSLFLAMVPSAGGFAGMVAAMTFVVAAVIEHDR